MLNNKTIVKVLSILIAIVLWIYVIMEENPTITQKFENIPVTILNEESLTQRGLTLLGDHTPTVTVILEGRRADVTKVVPADIIVTADVFGYSIGENHIPVNVDTPDSVSVADVKSNKIKVQIDETISVAKIVKIVETGDASANKELGNISLQPNEVMITGAKTLVDTVTNVYANIDISDFAEKGTTVNSPIIAENAAGEEVANIKFSSQTAEISASLFTTKEVDLNVDVVGEVDSRYTVSEIHVPDKITIKGTRADIEAIEAIDAVQIDISDAVTTTKIKVEPVLPEGIYVADVSKDTNVQVIVKSVSLAEIEIPSDRMVFLGLEEGLFAKPEDLKFTLAVSGTDALVHGMSIGDFTLSANLLGLKEGVHTVPVTVEYTKAFRSVSIEPQEIQVTVNEVR